MQYLDMAGNVITIGAYIVYAIRVGNSSDMKMGKVVGLDSGTSYYATESRPIIKVSTVVKEYNKNWRLQKNGKPFNFSDLGRVYVIENVPDEVKELLEGISHD